MIMRKIGVFIAASLAVPLASASAADMPVKAPPVPYVAPFSWTGIYVGLEGGYGGSTSDSTRLVGNSQFLVGTTDSEDRYGGLFGGVIGGNYQINSIVLGAEADWQWSGINGTATEFANTPAGLATNNRTLEDREINWISTVTGRVGYAWDRWLLYFKGGAAWRRVNDTATNDTFNGVTGALISSSSVNATTESGYVLGGGLEWAPVSIPALSLRIEGDWYDFGNNLSPGGICLAAATTCGGVPVGSAVAAGDTTTKSTAWEIKGGVNWRFNWPAATVAAKD
jgi:outer membrane immunogenic protein